MYSLFLDSASMVVGNRVLERGAYGVLGRLTCDES